MKKSIDVLEAEKLVEEKYKQLEESKKRLGIVQGDISRLAEELKDAYLLVERAQRYHDETLPRCRVVRDIPARFGGRETYLVVIDSQSKTGILSVRHIGGSAKTVVKFKPVCGEFIEVLPKTANKHRSKCKLVDVPERFQTKAKE